MTTIHAQFIGDQALIARTELDCLLRLARQTEAIDLQLHEDEVPTQTLMRLADQGGAFDFWNEEGENIYSEHDGEPV